MLRILSLLVCLLGVFLGLEPPGFFGGPRLRFLLSSSLSTFSFTMVMRNSANS